MDETLFEKDNMKNITKYYKKMRMIYIAVAYLAIIISIFFLPSYSKIEKTGNNVFEISLNDQLVGTVYDLALVDDYIREARLEVVRQYDEMVLIETNITVEGSESLVGYKDSEKAIKENIKLILEGSVREMLNRSYTVKIDEYMVNLSTVEEVTQMLQACVDRYDLQNEFKVGLVLHNERELNVLTTEVTLNQQNVVDDSMKSAGIESFFEDILKDVESNKEKEFADYDLGLKEIDFEDTVEIVESYLLEDELTSLDDAITQVTQEKEEDLIYKVESGDSLSLISLNTNVPMDKIIEMNDSIEDEFSTIGIGQEIVITVPEPNVSLVRKEEIYLEENYDADIIYIPNDEKYTNDKVTLQEPSAGHRNIVSTISYRNDKEVLEEILKEELVLEAVPKIIERGTIIPPTYIKPLAGGRMSSGYGARSAPVRGATTYHKAIDWATPVGSAIWASSAGRVSKAGWGGGYGYVVYIDHENGRQTRYAHLSKTLVKVGEYVEQGERIALSGNTGNSSGPHVHFELLIHGSKVNPFDHIN